MASTVQEYDTGALSQLSARDRIAHQRHRMRTQLGLDDLGPCTVDDRTPRASPHSLP